MGDAGCCDGRLRVTLSRALPVGATGSNDAGETSRQTEAADASPTRAGAAAGACVCVRACVGETTNREHMYEFVVCVCV